MNPTDWINSYKKTFGLTTLPNYSIEAITELSKAFDKYGDGDVNKFAAILANVEIETRMGKYDTELGSNCINYEGRSDLGNTQSGDGCRYKGRGLIQITGRRNYRLASQKFGVDFISNPNLVTNKKYSAPIAVWGTMNGVYTGKKLSDYINSSTVDFYNARRTVNGLDKASTIADYAKRLRDNYSPTLSASLLSNKKVIILVVAFLLIILMSSGQAKSY